MRRRDVVAGGLALVASRTAVPGWALAEAASPRIDRIIDAHCHIFNADDVPVEGFVSKVFLPKYSRTSPLVARFQEYPGALQALLKALVVQVKRSAPDVRRELTMLNDVERDPRRKRSAETRRRADLANIERVLDIVWGNKEVYHNVSIRDGVALEVALENLQLFLVRQFSPLFGRPVVSQEDREVLLNWRRDTLAQRLYEADSQLGHYIRWALLFTAYRYELAEELDQVHGRSVQNSRIALLTPAIVDLGKWLDDPNHTAIHEQVDAMSALARRKSGPRVHGFVGFDPLRQALYDAGRRAPGDRDPLAVVRGGIEVVETGSGPTSQASGGLIGVKLYPPMGFRASANAELEDIKFNIPSFLRSREQGLAPQIGSKLDTALTKMYQWCNVNNVPIMAHVNNSFGPSDDYEKRAHPMYWKGVLDRFPRLRINMAHFGHFEELAGKTDAEIRAHLRESWEWTVGEIITRSADSYAYADLSSLDELLRHDKSQQVLACMIALKESFPSIADRLLYGTDWSMVAQYEGFPGARASKLYPDLMIVLLKAAGFTDSEIEGVMFKNAARFLGLSKAEHDAYRDNCTRGRLEKFYVANRLPTDWMKAFD